MPSLRPGVAAAVSVLAVVLGAGSCTGGDDGPAPEGGEDGEMSTNEANAEANAEAFHDHSGRAAEFIELSVAAPDRAGPTRWIAVAEAASRGDTDAAADLAALTPEDFAASFDKIDNWADTADFDLLYLLNLRLGYADDLPPELVEAIDERLLGFKYWYTDSTPGVLDNRWYWSENHRIIFHTLELLSGETFPEEEFAVPGPDGEVLTGRDHVARATELIDEWLDEKARYGFSEWHSDVYYQKDLTPLLTLVEFSADERLRARAAAMLDVFWFDLAVHQVEGNVGVTHGRSYAKDKLRAGTQGTFGALWVVLGTSDQEPSPGDAGAVLFSRAQEYRVPRVVHDVAHTGEQFVDRQRMGVAIDPHEPLTDDPVHPDGLSYVDPDMVPFWWERGALTPWQTVGLTIDAADRYRLWDTELFGQFRAVRDVTGGDPEVARTLAADLAPIINIGLLAEVDTYTWRDDAVMLSSAIDYRPGEFGHQYHAWQATLDEDAVVFTTSPGNEPRPNERWPDADLYWTGGVQPLSQQRGPAAVHVHRPVYADPGDGLLGAFRYLGYTHAYFPTERFDEVVQTDGWTFGRVGDRFVGLWSWRPTTWRDHTTDGTPTDGLTEPFDLVAEGGPDNVWVVEVGRVGDGTGRYGDFSAFREALVPSSPQVTQAEPTEPGVAGEITVVWDSPGAGTLEVRPDGTLRVDGELDAPSPRRVVNPFASVPVGGTEWVVTHGGDTFTIDLATGTRTAAPT